MHKGQTVSSLHPIVIISDGGRNQVGQGGMID